MRLLDLCCCEGGSAMGYFRAGVTDITGVDCDIQLRYPFNFVRGDALQYLAEHGHEYDFIHASPPCQGFSKMTPVKYRGRHPDMISAVRAILQELGKPYVIENVEGARGLLVNPMLICGSMVGLPVFRHRYFELSGGRYFLSPSCQHGFKPVLLTDHGGPNANGWGKPRKRTPVEVKREAAQVSWMSEHGITQCVPPAFTEYLWRRLQAA